MTTLSEILIPGEAILLRLPSLWGLWLPTLLAVIGLLNLSLSAHGLATGSGDFVRHIAHVAVSLIMLVVGIYMGRRLAAWRILVTDRRLPRRTLPGREKFDEVPLAGIDEIKPYRLGDGLFVIARGRKIILPCKKKPATRIREATEAARGTE